MKKSLFFGVPLALVVLAFFAGCPQSSEEDPTGDYVGAYETTPEGIAIAFADEQSLVYLRADLSLGAQEVVVPSGKTLDFSKGVTITNVTKGGKLIVADGGVLKFPDNNDHDILWFKYTGGIIIATQGFIDSNIEWVEFDTSGNPVYGDDTKHIKATEKQVIPIQNFGDLTDDTRWTTFLDGYTYADGYYIPITYNGEIGTEQVKKINYYGKGHRLYLIGNVTVTEPIDLVGKAEYTPATPDAGPALFNAALADDNGSLVVAGNVIVFGKSGRVRTATGFSVFGTLVTSGDRENSNFINEAGPLVAYYLDLKSGGATFGGDVHLLATAIPSDFYTNGIFKGAVRANGKVIITNVSLSGTLSAPVIEFKGESSEDIVLNGAKAIIELTGPNPQIIINNRAGKGVDVNDAKFQGGSITATTGNLSLTYDQAFVNDDDGYEFLYPAEFNGSFTFKGGSVTFRDVIFNNEVTFAKTSSKISVGTFGAGGSETTFNRAVNFTSDQVFKDDGDGGFGGPVTFYGNATFNQNIDFAGTTTVGGILSLPKGGSFTNVTTLEKDFTFGQEQPYLIGTAGLTYGDVKIAGSEGATYGIVKTDNGTVVLSKDTLTISSGKLTLGTASIIVGDPDPDIDIKGKVVIDGSGAGSIGIEFDQYSTIEGASYRLTGGNGGGGTLALLQGSGGAVTLGADGISGGGANRPTLVFTGTEATSPFITWSIGKEGNDVNVSGVAVKLFSNTGGAGTLNIDNTGTTSSPFLVLKGGNATESGALIISNTYTITGDKVNPATTVTSYNTGYLVTLGDAGTFASGSLGGTVVYKNDAFAGSQGWIASGTNGTVSAIYGSYTALQQFVEFPVPIDDKEDALLLYSSSKKGAHGTVIGDVAPAAGSIGVFSQYTAAPAPTASKK
jgi:hypothetical protein